ncbi:MAG: aldehyde dehydrogenase family protein [Deinococcus-Thermus bacterium]|jgi:acyl-CoA reductase-like NAD-dependent aldehyde dehydrogenase|nr:aldehyde dehydrogenase family protein [Deinococcota bacterium]
MTIQRTISPIDGSVYVERELAGPDEIERALDAATDAQRGWRETALAGRVDAVRRMVEILNDQADEIALELAWQMGRPVRFGTVEIRGGHAERALAMAELAPEALADVAVGWRGDRPVHQALPPDTDSARAGTLADQPHRRLRHVPHGVVLVLAPWNYPFLTAVNAVVPALLAGNAVVLKHAAQTPLASERMAAAFHAAGVPEGVIQPLHLSHDAVAEVIGDPRVGYVHFTGSVEGGRAVKRAAAERFIEVGLELGGKDPGYVRADADLDHAAANLADGAFFNSGQSCCGIERIYVHRDVAEPFLARFVAEARKLHLGDPRDPDTTLGPMARASGAALAREHVAEAVAAGARTLLDPADFPAARDGTAYMAPQALVGVSPDMRVMREETFGPVVGIVAVEDDDAAVAAMNDSDYGLTASIWTRDLDAALRLGGRLETGTCYANRCDYLDPLLAWTGVKDSGRGVSLSKLGFAPFTRPMSFRLQGPG